MPSRNLFAILIALLVSFVCYRQASHNRFATTVAEAMEHIRSKYVEPVEKRALFENAMQGMVQNLDPHSSYIPPSEFKKWEEALDQKFGGIGVMIYPDPRTKRPMVMSPIVDSPAFRAGIRAGDLIMSVDGIDTQGISNERAVSLVQGKEGTEVTLVVLPSGKEEPVTHKLIREIVPIESVLGDVRLHDGTWDFRLEEAPRIGYIRIVSFGAQTATELKKALTEIVGSIDGLILDLRGNEGGLLTAAVQTCDMFLADGEIVREQGRGDQLVRRFRAHPGNELVPLDLPIVILIDQFSASASEIVAACFQDHGRAAIAGQRSWGKGTVQGLIELEGGRSALRLTMATFWRPNGENIHRHVDSHESESWGVQPEKELTVILDRDAYVKMTEARRDRDMARRTPETAGANSGSTESTETPYRDDQLKKAIEFLKAKIAGARPSLAYRRTEFIPFPGTAKSVSRTE